MKRQHGSPKGQTKPIKRCLDAGFQTRLKDVMKSKSILAPALAAKAHCTKQAIYRYTDGDPKTIEAHLLFDIADALEVDPRWLLKGKVTKSSQ
jgi:transcriptional regulator with XRE-family HTH domain